MSDQRKFNKLHGTKILILGGSSGIGYAVAEGAIEEGAASVIISSSNPDKISAAVEKLKKAYPSRASVVSGETCDLANQSTLEDNIKNLLSKSTDNGSKKIDHIVVTAGGPSTVALDSADPAKIQEIGVVRFVAPIMIAKHARTFMNPGPASSVTLTSGVATERPFKGWGAMIGYASSVYGIVKGMAIDLAPLRWNVVLPGAVDTELWRAMPSEVRDGFDKMIKEKQPTGVLSGPENVAETYLYLMKDHNMTGQDIITDGGYVICT